MVAHILSHFHTVACSRSQNYFSSVCLPFHNITKNTYERVVMTFSAHVANDIRTNLGHVTFSPYDRGFSILCGMGVSGVSDEHQDIG